MPAGTIARSRVRIAVCASLAAAGLVVVQSVRSQSPPPWTVGAWLTTADQENLLAPQAAPSFAPDSGSNPLTIDVDPSTTYQVMDGFGAALTDSSAWLIANRLAATPVNARHELLVQLFDRAEGIGLGYLRVPIGASDFALSHYTYDDVPAGQSDPGLARFSIDHDRAYILPVLREVLSINPELRVVAAPWSAPGWMKTSGSLAGGSLRTDAESAYADYLVRFLQAYEAEGVPIERLTVQNEPRATAAADYPGMLMSATQQARLIGRYLGPALDAAGLETKVDAWDHNWDDTAFAASIFADPEASTHTAGSAWHCYAGEAAAMTSVRDRHPDKDVLVTECSGGECLLAG